MERFPHDPVVYAYYIRHNFESQMAEPGKAQSDWIAALERGRKVDPDNALYDYLLAYTLLAHSTQVVDEKGITFEYQQSRLACEPGAAEGRAADAEGDRSAGIPSGDGRCGGRLPQAPVHGSRGGVGGPDAGPVGGAEDLRGTAHTVDVSRGGPDAAPAAAARVDQSAAGHVPAPGR